MTTLLLLLACSPEPFTAPGAPPFTPPEAEAPTADPASPYLPDTPSSPSGGLYVSPRCDAMAHRPDEGATFYGPSRTYTDTADRSGPYPTVSPDKAGLSEAMLENVSDGLDDRGFVQSFLVFVEGELAWEHYGETTVATDSHNIHAASKSLLAAAVGIALQNDVLGENDTLGQWLPEATEGLSQAKKDITVRQLMEMTGGFDWVEGQTEAEIERSSDWIRAILERDLVAEPGTRFHYNTGQTHLLSAVLQQATGRSTCDYVHEVLLDPLHIDAERWSRDPQGVFSGGYDVTMTPRELARFGLMVQQNGMWEEEQIVPRRFIDDMLTRHQNDRPYGYGLLWWNRPMHDHQVHIAWGYGGQFIYLVPDLDLTVVITTDTDKYDPWFWDAEHVLYDALIPALDPRAR